MISRQNREDFFIVQGTEQNELQWRLSWANQMKKNVPEACLADNQCHEAPKERPDDCQATTSSSTSALAEAGVPQAHVFLTRQCWIPPCWSLVCFAVLPGQSAMGRKKLLRWEALHSKATISMKLVGPAPSLCTVTVIPSPPLGECVPVQHNMFWSAALF